MGIEGIAAAYNYTENVLPKPAADISATHTSSADISMSSAKTGTEAGADKAIQGTEPEKVSGGHGETQDQQKQTEQTPGSYDQAMAKKAMENMKSRIRALGKEAIFDYNDDIERFTITIVDKDSKEVIKEIPSEQTQKMIEHIHTLRGMMLDEEV